MSRDVFELVKEMDLKDVETQLALQCAPLIAGLKASNLLIIPTSGLQYMKRILRHTGISYDILLEGREKTTVFLYNREHMEACLAQKEVVDFLKKMGYQTLNLADILEVFQKRYQNCIMARQEFPHEMGLLLGYPLEDVDGFIKNGGKNFLYTGYWKVYKNLSAKVKMFDEFEQAREKLVRLVYGGGNLTEVMKRRTNVLYN